MTGLLAVLFLTVGCQKQYTEKNEAKDRREPLVIWSYFETGAQRDGLDRLMRGFNLSQTKYEAAWEYVPMTEFTKKLTMAYTEEALPDVAVIDNPNMPMCIKMGMFEDITEFLEKLEIKEHYYASCLETVTYEERMYGLPATCNNVALIYNKAFLEEAEIAPPKTWEELKTASAALTTDERYGFLMSVIEGEQGAFQLLPWIFSTGETKEEIGGAGTEKAFSFLNNLIGDGSMTGNCINLSQTDVARVFVNGDAAMMENGPWVFPMLEEAGIDYGVTLLPVDKKSSVIVGGENLGILKGKNLEGAKLFLEYYNQDRNMEEFCRKSCVLPPKTGFENKVPSNMQVFQEQMKSAVVRSTIPNWNHLSNALPLVFGEMTAGAKTPAQAAQALKVDKKTGVKN